MYRDWFYTADAIFGHEVKATERPPPDNLTRWIVTQSKGFTRKDIEQISRSVRAYAYLVLTFQVQARQSIAVIQRLQWMLKKSLRARLRN